MTVYCTRCGSAMDDSARFCPSCGNAIASPNVVPPAAQIPVVVAPQITPAVAAPPTLAAPVVPAGQYGGFWVRFLAVVIDAILLTVAVIPVYLVMFAGVAGAGYAVGMPWTGRHLVARIGGRGLFFFAGWLYEALMWSSPRQATVGKMLLHLRVTDPDGNRISFARASGRHFAKYVSAIIFFIGYIMAAFTDRHQALHDMIAGTVVRQD